MRVGARVLISEQAEADWRLSCEQADIAKSPAAGAAEPEAALNHSGYQKTARHDYEDRQGRLGIDTAELGTADQRRLAQPCQGSD